MDIYLKMLGGLGNQLFEYAFSENLMKRYKAKTIKIDISGYKTYKVRDFELNKFTLNKCTKICNENIFPFRYNLISQAYRVTSGLRERLTHKNLDNIYSLLSQYNMYCAALKIGIDKNTNIDRNIYIRGYFQDIKSTEVKSV